MKIRQFRLGFVLSAVWALGAGAIAYFYEYDGARATSNSVFSVCMFIEDSWRTTLVPPEEPSPYSGRDRDGKEIAKPLDQYAQEKERYEIQSRVYHMTVQQRLETEQKRHAGCEDDRTRTMLERTEHIYEHAAIAAFAPLPIFWLLALLARLLRRSKAGSA
jgi:hypothetical protein